MLPVEHSHLARLYRHQKSQVDLLNSIREGHMKFGLSFRWVQDLLQMFLPSLIPTMRTSRFIEELTMKLIYRAQTFDYNPRPRPIQLNYKPCSLSSTPKDGAVKLIYRGQAFEYTPPPIQPHHKPRAMNWRFQIPMVPSKSRKKQTGSSDKLAQPCLYYPNSQKPYLVRTIVSNWFNQLRR